MDSSWSTRARIWRKQRSPTKACGVSMSMIGENGFKPGPWTVIHTQTSTFTDCTLLAMMMMMMHKE